MHRPSPRRSLLAVALFSAVTLGGVGACSSSPERSSAADSSRVVYTYPDSVRRYKSEVDEGTGVSVVIVLDNSGSMKDKVDGDNRPKSAIAVSALAQTLAATDAAIAKRPDYPINVGVVLFSGKVSTILPVQRYNRDTIRAVLARLPRPRGSTAIGDAMEVARQELYRAGTFRKVMLVLTDGENTTGSNPAVVAREIAERSEGGVGIHFIAFDTDADKFSFVRDVKGELVTAQNSTGLQASLSALYESKVLAESTTEPTAPIASPTRASPAPAP